MGVHTLFKKRVTWIPSGIVETHSHLDIRGPSSKPVSAQALW